MKTLKNVSFFVFVFLALGFTSALFAQAPVPSAEDEVIALTYKIWKAEMNKDMTEMNKYLADDYTEFNSDYSTRVDGKKLNVTLSEAVSMNSGTIIAAEMLNPKVQVYGDVAILSYNYAGVGKDIDGKLTNTKAKSTRVYVKMNGEWKLVHANFALDPNNG
jgi:ketosteroid isomerase-like protein